MNISIEKDGYLEIWLADHIPPDLVLAPLSDEVSQEVVNCIKEKADRYWFINPNVSLECADRIIGIGRARHDKSQEALGLMARGDALKFLGNLQEAWEMLEQSGNMYQTIDDEVGWARTRIGRLWLGLKLNYLNDTLADVDRARRIFLAHDEPEKLMRLEMNTAYVHTQRGDQQEALRLYRSALEVAERLGQAGEQHLGLLHMNIGFVYEALGDFPRALLSYEKARDLYIARNETRSIANIELNIAYIAQAQGQYRHALRLLYGILGRGIEQFPVEEKAVKRDLTECFLYLNRYSDARDLARQIVDDYRNLHAPYDTARSLLLLGTSEAELGNYAAALSALEEAQSIFTEVNATTWTMIARLRYGQVALNQGNPDVAREEALATVNHFQQEGHRFHFAAANLLLGRLSLSALDFDSATAKGQQVLQFAKQYNVPSLRYAAYLLLARVANAQTKTLRAIRCYQAAAATIERVQRGLTITLRSGFLEDKSEAGRQLVSLYLTLNQSRQAFEALERTKSQALLSYIGDRDQFHWTPDHPESQDLLKELETLRAEHHQFYRLAHEVDQNTEASAAISPEKALSEAAARERRMRAITEQLYLHNSRQWASTTTTMAVKDVQQAIDGNALLIEYFSDGKQFWAFTLDGTIITAHPLAATTEVVDQLIRQLQMNISTALRFDPQSPAASRLTHSGQLILQRLHSLLLEPLQIPSYERERLIIVPYGALHYLPFNLLYDGTQYLIERFEVVVLPTAALITRPGPQRAAGAVILSHSWDSRLPYTQLEAQSIQQIFEGDLYMEESASRRVLQRPPSQILHIAAHGQHRLDQPDLSFVELADGQLYADDLLQQDLSYELVTLSACETGRANVAADEELIGIGRGLLYAGAGALILSLWQVADSSTIHLMEHLYKALKTGESKAAALRHAQLSFLQQDRQLHPALWGAFQLIGNAGPLSTIHE